MIFTKKQLKLLVQENLSFVYMYICETYGYSGNFEDWLNLYNAWLKEYTGKNSNKEKK